MLDARSTSKGIAFTPIDGTLPIQAEAAAFDYRTPPPNWQPRVPAGRSVETPAGTRTTPGTR